MKVTSSREFTDKAYGPLTQQVEEFVKRVELCIAYATVKGTVPVVVTLRSETPAATDRVCDMYRNAGWTCEVISDPRDGGFLKLIPKDGSK